MGPGAPELAQVQFNLGMIATDLGEFDVAEGHLEAARRIDEAAWGATSIEVARDRFAQAYLDFGRGQFEAGCAVIDELLPIYEAALGRVHDETASVINALAVCRYYACLLYTSDAADE